MDKKQIIVLIGGGGHCKVIIDALRKIDSYEIEGIVDPGIQKDQNVLGVEVLGGDEVLGSILDKGVDKAFICVGSIGDCSVRASLYEKIKEIGFSFPSIIHPSAIIADDVRDRIGEGTFIAAGSIINSGTQIGKNAIINTSSSIDHDCNIGDYVHIAPGVVLSGEVKVGDRTHIGTSASVVNRVVIGKECFIGAGSVVKNNQPDGASIKEGNYV